MNTSLNEARSRFLQCWGEMGSCWGINKTMAQIHALLMVHEEPLSTDEVMRELNISRGNANMNLRSLVDWGLVRRSFKKGERDGFAMSASFRAFTKYLILNRRQSCVATAEKTTNCVKFSLKNLF